MLAAALLPTPLGTLWLVAEPAGLVGCGFGPEAGGPPEDLATYLARRFPGEPLRLDPEAYGLPQARAALAAYFAGTCRDLPIPCAPRGSPFQQAVWRALRRIPPGTVQTYGQLAQDLGRPGAARAVGRACAENPVAVVVPCHRVVAAGGRPGGYAGGLWRKAWLLRHEGVVLRTA